MNVNVYWAVGALCTTIVAVKVLQNNNSIMGGRVVPPGKIHVASVGDDVGTNITAKPVIVMPHESSPSYTRALALLYRKAELDPAFVAGDPLTDPAAYVEINNILPTYLEASNNGFRLWNGTNNATGNFAQETGRMIGFPFVIDRGTETFSFANVRVTVAENGSPQVLNQTISYVDTRYGQSKGILNGNVIDQASPSSAPVNKLIFVVGVAYTVNSLETVTAVAQHVAATDPFVINVTVELWSQDGQTLLARKRSSISTVPNVVRPRITIRPDGENRVLLSVIDGSGLTYKIERTTRLGSPWVSDAGSTDGVTPVIFPTSLGPINLFRLVH